MPIVQPDPPRHKIEDLGNSLRIIIPSRRNWFTVFLLIVVWLLIGSMIVGPAISTIGLFIRSVLQESDGGVNVGFLIVQTLNFSLVIMFISIFALPILLWQLAGNEVVEADSQSIKVRRQILGFGLSKEYLAEHMKDLRASSITPQHSRYGWSRSSFGDSNFGSIAFDYGARTFRFGSGVDEAEAKQIIAAIQQHFPQYRQ